MRKAEKLWEKALKRVDTAKSGNQTNNTIVKSGNTNNLKYSKEIDSKLGNYWQVENSKDIFKGINNIKELKSKALDYLLNGNTNFEYVVDTIDGKPVKFIRISAKEYVYGRNNKKLQSNQYQKKMRMAPSIDDLIENANITYHSPLTHQNKLFPEGFNNYQGKVGIDNDIFRYLVRVGKMSSGDSIFYDVSLELLGQKNKTDNKVLGTKSSSLKSVFINNSIPQKDNTVNTNNMQKSKNNTAPTIKNNALPKYSIDTVFENKNMTYNANRTDIQNAILDAESKPHGLYLSNLYDTDFAEFSYPFNDDYPNGKNYKFKVSPKKPLNVPNLKLDNKKYKYRNVDIYTLDADASVSALKLLVGKEEFERLSSLDKNELFSYLSNKFPEYDFSKYFDKLELLMAYGSIEARKKGYDVILTEKSNNKYTKDIDNEMVVLKNNVLNRLEDFENKELENSSSFSMDNKGRELTKEQQTFFKDSKIRDKEGRLLTMYHGTKRADRVGTFFDPKRATSGPMAFFTDNYDIAQNYSTEKGDTSLSREYDTEYDLFKANNKNLDDYWNSLNRSKQLEIIEKANNVGLDDDFTTIVYEERASENSFGDEFKRRLKREYSGNALKSLYSIWIEDGNLMGEEMSKFKEVLELAGAENVDYLDLYKTEPKVYDVYLNIKNPFDTSNIPQNIINQFIESSKKVTVGEKYSADAWDKSNIEPNAWIDRLNYDIKNGTTHTWTVIPDWVTAVLKANGYDGIIDTGGKNGGIEHRVVIPFYSNQIKNVDNEVPTLDKDIRYSLDDENSYDIFELSHEKKKIIQEIKNVKITPTVSEKTTIETELKKLKNTLIKTYDIKNENKKRLDDIFTQYSENKNTDIFLSELMKFSEYITIEDMNDGKDILRDLKSRRIAVDTKTKEDIANYNDFRKSMFGNLVLTNSGIPVDVHYQELSNIRPDLFPNTIVNPADQLQKIAETVKILKKPYLLKDIIGQEALENDIISTAMNFIENNKIISNIVLGGNDGKTRDVNERHSTRISETTAKGREKAPTTKRPIRKFYTSVKNAPVISEMIKKELKPKEYRKLTNDESMATAIVRLNNNPEEESLWRKRDVNKTNSVDVAEGLALLSKYQHEGKYESALEVIDRLAEIGTKGGQQVQMFALLQRLTPEGMVKYARQSLKRAKEEVEKFKNQKWLDEHAENYKLNEEDTKFITERMEKVVRMEDGRDKQILLAEISKRVSDKLPPVRGASIKAYMRISMLFNPKTQVRNIAGNMLIAPVNAIADTFATAVDKAVAKKTGIRTKGLTDVKSVVEGTVTGIYKSIDDFKRGIDTRNINADRFEIGNGTRGANFSNKTQLGKAMNSLDRTLSFMLDLGDRPFYESAFLNSINNQMKLNKVSSPTPNMIEIATTEALQRTWQDNNAYTTAVLKIRDILNGKVTKNSKGFRYGIGDLLIPFAKTPANLTKAIVDYSPVGAIKTLASDSRNLINAISRNDKDVVKYQHKFVDNLGKGMAGSLLYIIGYALAKAGISTGENDEDKDVANFMKNTLGIQPYSIKLGNTSFTYDWAQPIATPMAIMSNYQKYSKNNPDATALTKALKASIIGSEQLLEQSFLTSINNVLNGNNDSMLENLIDEILALPSRAVATLLKQIADMVDSTQRTTFDKTNKLATARNKVISKLPVASMMLAPSVDTMGREIKKYGGDNNVFNVFFNPANTNKGKLTESSEEIYNVYKETGDKTIFPIQAPYSVKMNGENTALDPYKRAIYQEITGKYTDSSIKSLLKNSNYKNLGNEDKVKVLKSVVEDSNLNAKKEVLEYKTEDETQKEKAKETGISLSNMYIYSEIISKMNGKKDVDGNTIRGSKQASMAEYIMAMKNTEEQKNKMLAETTTGENKVTVSDLNSVGLENYTQFLSISNQKSKETYKQLVSTGMNSNELNKYWNNIGDIKGQKDENGNTISGSKKKAVQQYINGLNVSKGEKLLLYASSGNYALTYSEKTELFNYIKSIKGMNNKEKQNLVNSLDCFK